MLFNNKNKTFFPNFFKNKIRKKIKKKKMKLAIFILVVFFLTFTKAETIYVYCTNQSSDHVEYLTREWIKCQELGPPRHYGYNIDAPLLKKFNQQGFDLLAAVITDDVVPIRCLYVDGLLKDLDGLMTRVYEISKIRFEWHLVTQPLY